MFREESSVGFHLDDYGEIVYHGDRSGPVRHLMPVSGNACAAMARVAAPLKTQMIRGERVRMPARAVMGAEMIEPEQRNERPRDAGTATPDLAPVVRAAPVLRLPEPEPEAVDEPIEEVQKIEALEPVPTTEEVERGGKGMKRNGGKARISDAVIAAIRAAPQEVTHTALAKKYGVSDVSVAKYRKTEKQVLRCAQDDDTTQVLRCAQDDDTAQGLRCAQDDDTAQGLRCAQDDDTAQDIRCAQDDKTAGGDGCVVKTVEMPRDVVRIEIGVDMDRERVETIWAKLTLAEKCRLIRPLLMERLAAIR